jgi:peroxiredoxin
MAAPPPASSTSPAARELTPTPSERLGTLAPDAGIPIGQKAPEVAGRDLNGHDVPLSSLYAQGPILLVFYRGGWCPYCNAEIRALTQAFPEFQKRGVMPVAVSVDTPESEEKMRATYSIPFPVLSDSPASMISAFHVVRRISDEELAKMKAFGVDLEGASGQHHHVIAVPSLFLVDRMGIVRWAHSDPDIKVRPSPQQILAALDATPL